MHKRIALVVVISLLVGFIHIYPDLKLIYETGSDFKGITLDASHDAKIYLGRISSVYLGDKKTIPAIDIYEHRQDPWTLPFLGELILGTVGSALKIPLNHFKIIFSFLLPVINFWLIYYLAFLLCNSGPAATVSAFAGTLGYSLFTNDPGYIYKLLFQKDSAIHLWFLRPISPQFNHLLLFTAWITAYFFLTRKKYLYAVLSGILTGSFLYMGGVYYFTYFLTFLILLVFLFFFERDCPGLVKTALMMIVAGILAIPFALNYMQLASLPQFKYFIERNAIIYGHKPIIPLGITALSAFIVWLHYTRKTKQAEFIILFVLAGLVCLNQQLITGRTSQPSHWQNYMVKTFVLTAFFPTAALFLRENKYLYLKRMALRNIAIVIFISLSLLQQENYYQRFKDKFREMQGLALPFSWLKENSRREDVVLNDPMNFLTDDIPYQQDLFAYARNYAYVPCVQSTLLTQEEAEHRYLSALRFFDYSPEQAESFFSFWNGIFFRGMLAEVSFGGSGMPEDYLLHLKDKYADFLKEDPLKLLSRYRINYVILGKKNRLYGEIDTIYKPLLKVYDDGQYKIYRISSWDDKCV